MATPPDFTVGQVLTAAQMNAIGLWRVTTCTVSSSGGTAATASNGVITIGNGNTSVTINNAFSSDFQNYRIVFSNMDASVGGQSLKMYMANSTGSTYAMGGIYGVFNTAASTAYGPATTTSWTDVLPLSDGPGAGWVDLFQPNNTVATTFTSMGVRTGGSAGWYFFAGVDTATTAQTGFVISPVGGGSSFVSGTVRVYGYRN